MGKEKGAQCAGDVVGIAALNRKHDLTTSTMKTLEDTFNLILVDTSEILHRTSR